jgi:hypothetical protein
MLDESIRLRGPLDERMARLSPIDGPVPLLDAYESSQGIAGRPQARRYRTQSGRDNRWHFIIAAGLL